MMLTPIARRPRSTRRGGFTLVEILVVIGVIVLLASIVVPLVGRAMRQAKQTRTAADMQAIATALEAFKADHGDYPRPEARNTGAAVLGRFLFGPYGDATLPPPGGGYDDKDPPDYQAGSYLPGDTVRNPGGDANNPTFVCVRATTATPPTGALQANTVYDWGPIAANDGIDGLGLQMRPGGKKYGPYLQEGKFKLRGLSLLDGNDQPILYFAARPGTGGDLTGVDGSGNPRPDNAYVYRSSLAPRATMKYDADDNLDSFRHTGEADNNNALRRIRAMLGDYGNGADNTGIIETDKGEKIATEAPFLLWSAGPDGLFGPTEILQGASDADRTKNQQAVDKCDDVVSFK